MIISWNTTNQCNMLCEHCYRDAGAKLNNELTTAQAKRLITEIKKAGFKIMIFSGGEPLMRNDIFDLASHAAEQGLRPVMGSNGTLISPAVADKIKRSGIMAVGISLDSMNPGKYNRFRKLDNAWELTVAGMQNLKKSNVPFQIHTTVMDWNVDELENLNKFAVQIGAIGHHVFFLVPTGRAINIEEEALRAAEYERTITKLMKMQKSCPIEIKPTCAPQFTRIADRMGLKTRFTKGCLAGISYCIISPSGDVQPCAYLDIKLGNVKQVSFTRIWEEDELLLKLRTMKYEGKCGVCDYKEKCGGCRARAYYYNHDILAEDTWCLYNP